MNETARSNPAASRATFAEPPPLKPTVESLRYPVRRDLWDTVDFYLLLVSSGLMASAFFLSMGISSIARGDYVHGGALILLSLVYLTWGAVQGALHVWRRFAEQYELTNTELVIHQGYTRIHAPLAAISRVYPVNICRLTTALKPAVKIAFRKPVAQEEGGFYEYRLFGRASRRPVAEFLSVDVAPVNLDGFLEELATRCPHLDREGLRFHPKRSG